MSKFQFTPPPEAPVFRPTAEEFKDPLKYIGSIRPVAEKCGICKIQPPQDWKPPFCLDRERFTFVPRVQKINELEAGCRLRLKFFMEITAFWDSQGCPLKVPVVGKIILDLFKLYQRVNSDEFRKNKTKEAKWKKLATDMGIQSSRGFNAGNTLKTYYERLVHPFVTWKQAQNNAKDVRGQVREETSSSAIKRRKKCDSPTCQVCRKSLGQTFVSCRDCANAFCHRSCLLNPSDDTSENTGNWRCGDCLQKVFVSLAEDHGFEDAPTSYSLPQFKKMADEFKSNHFGKSLEHLTDSTIETEFWRVVSAYDENVEVKYGADVHALEHGSGFPKSSTIDNQNPEVEKYAKSGWNLNNLPVLSSSVLSHVKGHVSGMKVPWLYVGMCFSAFCWHNEDHWTYSISYLHWGDPKTWYGVPGKKAKDFEATMKAAAPDLFELCPDMLHHLVTMLNPNVLMKAGVPVYRTDQRAGEFIVTFPRAYHAGFNQGYNFAEAVNFAPADWISIGRESVEHYRNVRRSNVFSHDELICTMAAIPEALDTAVATGVFQDLAKMQQDELDARMQMRSRGILQMGREVLEDLPEDCRQCHFCRTELYLSAVTCACSVGKTPQETKRVCLKHYDKLPCGICKVDDFTLKYRHSSEEFLEMLGRLRKFMKRV